MAWFGGKKTGGDDDSSRDEGDLGTDLVECPRCHADVRRRDVGAGLHQKLEGDEFVWCN